MFAAQLEEQLETEIEEESRRITLIDNTNC